MKTLLPYRDGPALSMSMGFTLVELIVVIGILGVLISGLVVLVNPVKQIQNANDTKRKSDLSQIQKALELYYQDYGRYPNDSAGKICIGGSYSSCTTPIDFGSPGFTPYIKVVPNDPKANTILYRYLSTEDQSYQIYAHMERGNDCNPSSSATACPGAIAASLTCGTGKECNYGVSSPNASP